MNEDNTPNPACSIITETGGIHDRWVCQGHDHEIDLTEMEMHYERAS